MLAGRNTGALEQQAGQLGPGVVFSFFDLRDNDPGTIVDEAVRLLGDSTGWSTRPASLRSGLSRRLPTVPLTT